MSTMRRVLVVLLLLRLSAATEDPNKDVVVKEAARIIDISSQVVRIKLALAVENSGSSTLKTISIPVDRAFRGKVSYFEALSEDGKTKFVAKEFVDQKGETVYQVTLNKPLAPSGATQFQVFMALTQVLQPYPQQIGQSEKQFMLFKGNVYIYLPYEVQSQTTKIVAFSSTIESYTTKRPVSVNDKTITYGPFSTVGPFSEEELTVHSENNSPFLTVVSLTRWIEVSHWGNIAVEESSHLKHSGAALKGHFSRLDFQMGYNTAPASVKMFKSVLPASARHVYYRDEIGNISTSHLRSLRDRVDLEVQPRFPLFGGWQTKYTTGYNVPSYEFLYRDGSTFKLAINFVDLVFKDFVIEDLTVKIVLPEGARDIDVKAPFDVKKLGQETHFTYLDTTGRPVLVLKKNNVCDKHIQDIEVKYSFSTLMLLREPLMLIIACFIIFFSVIALVRLDFSITKDETEELQLKIRMFSEQSENQFNLLSNWYQSMDSTMESFKASKDTASFTAAQKKLSTTYASLLQGLKQLACPPGTADKLESLVHKENERRKIVDQEITLVHKVVEDKINRTSYIQGQRQLSQKRSKLTEEIDALMATL